MSNSTSFMGRMSARLDALRQSDAPFGETVLVVSGLFLLTVVRWVVRVSYPVILVAAWVSLVWEAGRMIFASPLPPIGLAGWPIAFAVVGASLYWPELTRYLDRHELRAPSESAQAIRDRLALLRAIAQLSDAFAQVPNVGPHWTELNRAVNSARAVASKVESGMQ